MASNRGTNGVLTMPVSLKGKKANMEPPTSKSSTTPGKPRLRLIVRRLPPGLTLAEFESTLGDEWQMGAGKIEWLAFKAGKVSKDPSNPSKPARVYLRVKEQGLLDALSTALKQVSFQDAKNTSKDPCLLGPPSLEFAPYGKVTGGRVRKDGRQGTIDQDPDFIDFLQSLTEPATKTNVNGEAGDTTAGSKSAKVNTTPLVEFLKEKKANKAKESSSSKASKSQAKGDSKDTKPDKADFKKVSVIKKESQKSSDKSKAEKAVQDAAKTADKSAVNRQPNTSNSTSISSPKASPVIPAPVKRERDWGSASVAAKMLRRDLGLSPKNEGRPPRGTAPALRARVGVEADSKASPPLQSTTESKNKAPESLATTIPVKPNSPQPSVTVNSTSATANPRGGKRATPTSQPSNRSAPTPTGRPPRQPPTATSGARSAFIKHASASQGVTEPLLQAAFSTFGEVTRCEIDRKKGFAYVDFEQPESLGKAMAASPVKIGEKGAQVLVLENKNVKPKPLQATRPPTGTKDMTTQPQSQPSSPAAAAAPVAPAVTKKPERDSGTEEIPKASIPPSTPTAPRAAQIPFKGGSPNHRRGSRRDNAGSPRAGFGGGGGSGREARPVFRGRGGGPQDGSRRGGNGPTSGKDSSSIPTANPARAGVAAATEVKAGQSVP